MDQHAHAIEPTHGNTPADDAEAGAADTPDVHARMDQLARDLDAELEAAFNAFDGIEPMLHERCAPRTGAMDAWSEVDHAALYRKTAESTCAAMVDRLRLAFHVDGVVIEFSAEEVIRDWTQRQRDLPWSQRETKSPRERMAGLTPSAVLAQFREAYKPDEWRASQCREAAHRLVRAFDLYQGHDIRRVGGRVELRMRIYADSAYSRPGELRLQWGAGQEIRRALGVVGGQDGYEAVRPFARTIGSVLERKALHETFQSRERVALPCGVDMVFFRACIKVYVPDDVFDALTMFISEHADPGVLDRSNRYY